MKEHEFTLILTSDPTDEEADRLYGVIVDGTPATVVGVPQIQFHRENRSLEVAIQSAIHDVRSAGLEIERVEMAPDAVAHSTG